MNSLSDTSPSYFFQLRPEYRESTAISFINNGDSDEVVSISYDLLHSHVAELERLVEKTGLVDNNKKLLILLECRNNVSTIVAYIYCLKFGHTALLVDAEIDPEYRQDLIEKYQPNLAFTAAEIINDSLPTINVLNTTELRIHPDLAVLLSTSGSTGSPKQVRLSYKNLQANAESICTYLKIDQKQRAITSLPLFYSYGLSVLNSHFNRGASLVLTQDSLVSKAFWQCFKKLDATSFAGVPHQYLMLSQLRFERMELPSLRVMTQAGGKLSEELTQKYSQFAKSKGIKFFVMYGQTEATARMSYIPEEALSEHIGSIGMAIPGGHFSLIDENDQNIEETNVTGELVYKGDNVMMGYALCRDDLVKGAELSSLKTGDLAYCDKDGFFFITGRKNRMAKVFGLRIDLFQLEERLKQLVQCNVACVEVNDYIYICIENKDKNMIDQQLIDDHLREKLKLHSSAYTVRRINKLPHTANAKIAYGELEEWVSSNNQ